MIKFDYHTHSVFSDDSTAPLSAMIEQAVKLGLDEIAVTDHFDPDYADPSIPFTLDYSDYHAAITQMQETYKGKIKIVRGLEVGLQSHVLEDCEQVVSAHPYDFVLGSIHCAEKKELYGGSFYSGRSLEESYVAYYRSFYECLKNYKNYCVAGHLNIVERYMPGRPDPDTYIDLVKDLLRLIIEDGKGIELNTSSFRYKMGDRLTPSVEMLKLYRSMGGEIITVGSDAHTPQYLADHFEYAEEVLKSVGFRYITVFERMKPQMKPL